VGFAVTLIRSAFIFNFGLEPFHLVIVVVPLQTNVQNMSCSWIVDCEKFPFESVMKIRRAPSVMNVFGLLPASSFAYSSRGLTLDVYFVSATC
jgi:hypothetical protein